MKMKLLIAGLLWSILILVVCSIPGDALPTKPFIKIPHFDKFVHAMLYLPYAIIISAHFHLNVNKIKTPLAIFITLMIVFSFGGIIELLQEYAFVHRSADWFDLMSDVIGGIIGLLLYYLFLKFLRPSSSTLR